MEGDEVAIEIDKAVYGYTSWVSTWVLKPVVTREDMKLPEGLGMTFTAALVLVTANLPGRIGDSLDKKG